MNSRGLALTLIGMTLFVVSCNQSGQNQAPTNKAGSSSQSANNSANKVASGTGTSAHATSTAPYAGNPASQAALDKLSAKASLISVLPADTVGYLRVPTIWGFVSAPKNNVLDKALRDKKHIEAVSKIRQGLSNLLINSINTQAKVAASPSPAPATAGATPTKPSFNHKVNQGKVFADFFLNHVRAPIEYAEIPVPVLQPVANPGAPAAPTPTPAPVVPGAASAASSVNVRVLRTRLNISSATDLNQTLKNLSQYEPQLKLIKPVTSAGDLQLKAGKETYFGKVDFSKGEVTLIGARVMDDARFQAALQKLKTSNGPLQKSEAQTETSRQGLFGWLNVQAVGQANMQKLLGNKLKGPQAAALAMIRSIAFGWGVHNGKSRIKYHVETILPLDGYVGGMGKLPALTSSGTPNFVFGMALPGPKQWKILGGLAKANPGYKQLDDNMSKYVGARLDDLVNTMGPSLLFFSDKTGYYMALQVRDKAKFKTMMDNIIKTNKNIYRAIDVNGKTIHHFAVKIPVSPALKAMQADPLISMLYNRAMHFYWYQDGDYLVLGGIPQELMDRMRYADKQDMIQWINKTQRQSSEDASLLLSFKLDSSPRKVYYQYLNILQMMADMTNTKIKLEEMPSADSLRLNKAGSMGIQVNVKDTSITAELMFEKHPLEFVGAEHVAMFAIMSAASAATMMRRF